MTMAQDKKATLEKSEKKRYSRRDFLAFGGAAVAGGALAVYAPQNAEGQEKEEYPLSQKYLLCDSRNCAGCYGCMIACSLVHEGQVNFSLSRIQVHRAVLKQYPSDIMINPCRQCPKPLCVINCPTGACHISKENGNVRMINADECIGCKTCIKSCPYTPHRPIWNHVTEKAIKCDLCTDTPFYEKKGGVNGSQACVDVCVANALKVVTELPDQADINGYDRNLQPPKKPMPDFFGAPKAKAKPE